MFSYPGDSGTGTMFPGAPFGPWEKPRPYPSPTGPVVLPPQQPPVQPVQPMAPQPPVEPSPSGDSGSSGGLGNQYLDMPLMAARSTTAHAECTVNNDGSSSCTVGVSTTW